MNTNQTINGVPRGLLESFAAYVSDSPNAIMRSRVKELRALLDVPEPTVFGCNRCGGTQAEWSAKCVHCHPAAQPQGEPVALTIQQRIKWMMCFNADLYEDWLGDNIPEDELQAWLTEEGVPVSLPGSQLAKVLSYELQYANSRLAEQPAPVAVMLPEFESAFEKWWEEDGQYCRAGGGSYEKTFAYRAYEAALSDVTRLNTK